MPKKTHHKALILTERDLQCQLHGRLSALPLLTGCHPTADPTVTGPRVHADLSWFDRNGRLSIMPDLSILEVDQLSIFRSIAGGRLPSKQFSFGGNAIILETKFCRGKYGITDAFFEREIKKDIDKIDGLLAKLEVEGFPKSLFCYFVVFSKSGDRGAMFQELQNGFAKRQCKLVYKTAGINTAGSLPKGSLGPGNDRKKGIH